MGYKKPKRFDYTKLLLSRRLPSLACIELTHRCNLKCIHCFNCSSPGKELSYEEIISLLDQLAEAGVLYLKLSGGEPLIRKDFFDIARYARKLEFAVTIYTNATLITEEIAEKISQLYPLAVNVSLYGSSEKLYRKVTGSVNSFDKAIRGIRLLSKLKTRVKVNALMFNFYTVKDALAMRTICKDLGVEWNAYTFFTPKTDGTIGPLKCGLSESRFSEFYKRLPELRHEPFARPPIHKRVCSTLRSNIYINPYGQVGNCLFSIRKETIRKKPLLDIWKKDPVFIALRKLTFKDLTTCFNCKNFPYCKPCPAENLATTGSFASADPQRCQQVYIKRKVTEEFNKMHNKKKLPKNLKHIMEELSDCS